MRWTLRGLVVSLAIVAVPGVCQAGSGSFQTSSEQQVLLLLNQIRQQHHLTGFVLSAPLRSAAREHTADMFRNAYFDHDSASESADVRIGRYVRSTLVGEDLAWGVGTYGSPAGLVNQWMRSAEHRAVILMPGLRRVGLGIALGTFGSKRNAIVATADFSG
ncbi:MAG TPA: CAP domain-containing protein [Gaiellales bacterium]|jgi:uncharacterized protein YkwD|nr:CAP domain-containing protein [Gaiellales bacterium]